MRETTIQELARIAGGALAGGNVAPEFVTDADGVTWMVTCTGVRIRLG